MDNVKAVLCNYKTLDITKRAIESFRKYYPTLPLTVIDGSGFDVSSSWLYQFAKADKNTTLFCFNYNIHHGPGMHFGISTSEKPLVLIFETDMVFLKGGVIETMLATVGSKPFHSIGNRLYVNGSGIGSNERTPQFPVAYVHPVTQLVNRDTYLRFDPYVKHGAPCIKAAINLHQQECSDLLIHFPQLRDFIKHDGKGTRSKYGLQI